MREMSFNTIVTGHISTNSKSINSILLTGENFLLSISYSLPNPVIANFLRKKKITGKHTLGVLIPDTTLFLKHFT